MRRKQPSYSCWLQGGVGVEEQKGVRQGEKDNVREKEGILEKQGDKY